MKVQPLLAEFLGTFFLCFSGIAAILSATPAVGSGAGIVGIALAHWVYWLYWLPRSQALAPRRFCRKRPFCSSTTDGTLTPGLKDKTRPTG